jgi:ferric-dicitrate binding protein FerR (iron transport regulator)
MIEEKDWDRIAGYLAGALSPAQEKEFQEWLGDDPERSGLLESLRGTWRDAADPSSGFTPDAEAAWKKVRQRIRPDEPETGVRKLSFRYIRNIAAAALVILSTGLIISKIMNDGRMITIIAKAGEQKEVMLPDGSTVWLNGSSEISYKDGFKDRSSREVKLEGEAFFSVEKDPSKPFRITTGTTLTTVLGTSFNVKENSDGEVLVAVFTGRVSFGPKQGEKQRLLLLPGDKGRYSADKRLLKETVKDTNFLFWKSGRLSFTDAPLGTVLATLEETYHVRFEVNDKSLLRRHVTTAFDHASFNEVSDVLETLLDVQLVRSGSTIVVRKK